MLDTTVREYMTQDECAVKEKSSWCMVRIGVVVVGRGGAPPHAPHSMTVSVF